MVVSATRLSSEIHPAAKYSNSASIIAAPAVLASIKTLIHRSLTVEILPRRRASVGGQAIELDVDPRYPVCYIQAPSLIYQP